MRSDRFKFKTASTENAGRYPGYLFGLVCLALLVKTVILLNQQVIANDGPRYVNQALQFMAGDYSGAFRRDSLFLYPLLLSFAGRLGFDLVLAGEAISALSSVLILFPLYALFEKLGDPRSALWSCLAFAVTPAFNKFSASVMRDLLFLLVVAWLLYLLWRALEKTSPALFLGCALLALACTSIRLEGVLIIPVGLLLLAVALGKARNPDRSQLLRCAGSYLAPLLLMLLVAAWYFGNSSGGFTRLEQVGNFVAGTAERGLFAHQPVIDKGLAEAQAEIGPLPENDFIQIVKDNVGLIYLVGLVRLLVADMWWPFFLLAGFGLWSGWGRVHGRLFLGVLVVAYLLMAYLYNIRVNYLDERYLFIPAMLLGFWTGVGVTRLCEFLRARLPKVAVAGMLLLLFAVPAVQSVRAMTAPQAVAAKEAGQWLAAQPSLRSLSLIANGEKIPFYGERGDDFIRAEFVRDFRGEVTRLQPGLIAIEARLKNIDDVSAFPGYELLVRFEDRKYGALIFRRIQDPERLPQ